MQSEQIDQLAQKIEALLPPGIRQLKQDFDQQLRTLLQHQLSKMNFVSRDEFEIQRKVLAKSRQKLEQLEKRIQAMEKTSSTDPD